MYTCVYRISKNIHMCIQDLSKNILLLSPNRPRAHVHKCLALPQQTQRRSAPNQPLKPKSAYAYRIYNMYVYCLLLTLRFTPATRTCSSSSLKASYVS